MASNFYHNCHNVFVIYCKRDTKEVSDLIKDISNVTRYPLDQDQMLTEEELNLTKSSILNCKVFVCCLSKNSSPLLFNIVKFARCVARKEINAYFINESDVFLKTKEEKSFLEYKNSKHPKEIKNSSYIGINNFFKYKTRIIKSMRYIREVSIFLEFIYFYDHLNNYMFIPC